MSLVGLHACELPPLCILTQLTVG